MKKKASQNNLVLAYVRAYGSISTMEAFQYLGITRLSARIFDLTQEGYCFKRDSVCSKNRLGDKAHFTRYSLVENAQK